jgi:general secretion pathway protein M
MNRSASLGTWWSARDARERVMLALMLLAIGAFVLWLGAWRPLDAAARSARQHRLQATTDLAEVRALVAAVAERQALRPAPLTGDALTGAITRSAAAGGVAISRQRTADDGRFVVGIDAVEAPALFAWLDLLARQHGVAPVSLKVEERDGSLAVEAGFATSPAS